MTHSLLQFVNFFHLVLNLRMNKKIYMNTKMYKRKRRDACEIRSYDTGGINRKLR